MPLNKHVLHRQGTNSGATAEFPDQAPWRCHYPLAAPSWVIPGGVTENAVFLAGRVDEVALCFFELQPCLEYTEQDLSPRLSTLPLSWHVHLPFDLPGMHSGPKGKWADGMSGVGEAAAGAALGLMRKIDFLKPGGAVLHTPAKDIPPAQSRRILIEFVESWRQAGRLTSELWLENTNDSDLLEFEDIIIEYDLAVCLDIGHVMAYTQNALLQADALLERIRLVHFSLPGEGAALSRHFPFSPDPGRSGTGTATGRLDFLPDLLQRLKPGTRLLPEIFSWRGYTDSAVFLDSYFRKFLIYP